MYNRKGVLNQQKKSQSSMSGVVLLLCTVCVCLHTAAATSSLPTDCSLAGWAVPKPPASGAKLLQVQAVIRHGDRTPWTGDHCWPQDSSVWDCYLTNAEVPMYSLSQYGRVLPRLYRKIYKFGNESLNGNCSIGQLTTLGYGQQMQNGMKLHDAYVSSGFLSPNISSSEVYVRSDDVPRTLQSAQALLFGMYPLLDNTTTQTVEMFTMDTDFDYMTVNSNLCPRAANYSADFLNSANWTSHYNSTTQSLLTAIKAATNFVVDEDDLDHFCDCLNTHYCHGLQWPTGMTSDLFHKLWAELAWQRYSMLKFPSVEENAKVGIGYLLRELWQNMDAMANQKPIQKFMLYSGHDSTLIPLLVALQVDRGVWPLYASMMLIELYSTPSSSSRYSVRILYNGDVLQLPFCNSTGDSLCDYKSFLNYLATVTPDDKTDCSPESRRRPNWKWY